MSGRDGINRRRNDAGDERKQVIWDFQYVQILRYCRSCWYVQDIYIRVEDVSVSRIRWVSSWRCWQLAPRSSRLSWRKTWAPSTRGEKSTSWESPERDLGPNFLLLFPQLHSAWLTCDHSCILKRTCLYLCILIPFCIVIVSLNAWCCRGKDGECPKSPEHVLCQVQQTRKVQGGRHLDDFALLTTSPHFQVTQYKKSAESKQAQGRRRWIIFSNLLSC